MTRVIHTGDTHLGYRQYHRPERRADFLDAFRTVAEDAVADDVDAVVHAGDLFHDRRPDLPDILGALDVLRTLADADVPFLAIVGNHETKRDAQWLDLFESLGLATRLGDEPVTVGDTAFYGLDFVPRSRRDELDYEFADHDAAHAALVAHGLFEPLVPDYGKGSWDSAEVLDRANVDFDAMLLGDEHTAGKAEVGDAWVTYCGSTERASASEREDRGYNIVEFDGRVSIRRRGLSTREFVFVDVELGEGEGVERVRERVGQHDLADAVVVVHVDGDGEPVSPARIEEFAAEEGALIARVTDHREVADTGEVDVSFADPDDAVRERIRDLGLSQAARDVDETVRASKVADSKVADEVEAHVRELLEAGDANVFAPAESDGSVDETAGASDEPDATDEDAVEADGGGSAQPDGDPPTEADDQEAPAAEGAADGDDDQPTLGEFE
ncbi:MAG: DNA double-strand break repair protein Mre11 [Haloarculaceae archaeon]